MKPGRRAWGRVEALWKRAETQRFRRTIVETPGGVLKQVETRGSAWKLEETHGNPRKREGTRENSWILTVAIIIARIRVDAFWAVDAHSKASKSVEA